MSKAAKCPDCGCEEFLSGPEGGMSVNIECVDCGADFNFNVFGMERIGWNNSGRWLEPGKLRQVSEKVGKM